MKYPLTEMIINFNINLLLVQNDKFGIWAIQNQFRVSETIG